MVSAPDRFIFSQIPIRDAATAFEFHQSHAANDEYIWPRKAEQIQSYAQNGELYGIRKFSSGELVGLSYMTLNESSKEVEFGGLMVSNSTRRLSLGTFLVNFALANLIAYAQPWANGQQVMAHVHELNDKPRKILKEAGFEQNGQEEAPPWAPASMKRNAQGKVIGDKFYFPKTAVGKLSSWFDNCDWVLRDHESRAEFDIPLDAVKATLRAIAAEPKQ